MQKVGELNPNPPGCSVSLSYRAPETLGLSTLRLKPRGWPRTADSGYGAVSLQGRYSDSGRSLGCRTLRGGRVPELGEKEFRRAGGFLKRHS